MTAELSEKIAQFLIQDRKRAYGDICSYVKVHANGLFDPILSAPCLSGIRGRRNGSDAVGIGHWVNDKKNQPYTERFTNWLSDQSPWKFVWKAQTQNGYTTHDWRNKYGFIVDNTDIPHNLLVGALIAIRIPTETRAGIVSINYAESWCQLVDVGIDPSLSLLVVGNLRKEYNQLTNKETDKFVVVATPAGHWPVNSACMEMQSVKNFMDGNPVSLSENFSTTQTYSDVNLTWGKLQPGDRDTSDTLNRWLFNLAGVKKPGYGSISRGLEMPEIIDIARELESKLK